MQTMLQTNIILMMVPSTLSLIAGSGARGAVHACHRCRSPTLGFFDQLASAFENDDTLGDNGPAGLKTAIQYTDITWLGPEPEGLAAFMEKQPVTEQKGIRGQSIKDLAADADIPIKYSCMSGTCHICDVVINGVTTPACMAKCGEGAMTIEYQDPAKMREYAKNAIKADRQAKKTGVEAPVANPLDGATGTVVPTNPFAGLKAPELPSNPFGDAAAPQEEAADEEEDEFSSLSPALARRMRLEKQIAAENEAKRGAKKGGWPFG